MPLPRFDARPLWVARQTGTSLEMIERHYGKPRNTLTPFVPFSPCLASHRLTRGRCHRGGRIQPGRICLVARRIERRKSFRSGPAVNASFRRLQLALKRRRADALTRVGVHRSSATGPRTVGWRSTRCLKRAGHVGRSFPRGSTCEPALALLLRWRRATGAYVNRTHNDDEEKGRHDEETELQWI